MEEQDFKKREKIVEKNLKDVKVILTMVSGELDSDKDDIKDFNKLGNYMILNNINQFETYFEEEICFRRN